MNHAAQISFLVSLYAVFFNSAGRFKEMKTEIQSALASRSALQAWRESGSDEDYMGILKQVSNGKNVELKPLGKALKELVTDKPDLLNPAVVKLVLRFSLYFRAGTESAAKKIQSASSSTVFPEWIRSAFVSKTFDQKEVVSELEKIVKKAGGRGSSLTREEADKLKATDPELFKQYMQKRKEFQLSWKNAASNFIRKSGQATVPMAELLKFLNSNGLKHNIIPGFTGRVSADLEWYDEKGERIAGVPSNSVYTSVQMNPSPQPGKFVFTAVPPEGSDSKPKYFFRAADLRQRREQKFQMVADVAPVISHARKVWLAGIKNFDPSDPKTVAALAIELAYQFACRIGTPGNATKGSATYGLSTALVKHIRFGPNNFTLTYPGKDGIKASHKYVANDSISRLVFGLVKDLVEGKKPEDPIFSVQTRNGFVPLRVPVVTQVFRKVVGHPKITIHKIRTLRATVLFSELMEDFISKNKGKEVPPATVVSQWKEMATQVGKELNHVRTSADGEQKVTHATALAAYIDVSAQQKLFDAFNVPYPPSLLKALGKHRLESSLLILAADEDELDPEESDPLMESDPDSSGSPGEDSLTDTDEDAGEASLESGEGESKEEAEGDSSPKKDPRSELDKERGEAERSAPEDAVLLTDILLDPGVAEEK